MRKERLSKGDLETVDWLIGIRWPMVRLCPHCSKKDRSPMIRTRALFQCSFCKKQYGIFGGTIFHGTRISPLKLVEAIIIFWKASYENYEALWPNLKAAQSKDRSKLEYRWKGPISVRKFEKLVKKDINSYSTSLRLHQKIAPYFKKDIELEKFIQRLLVQNI